MIGRHLEDTGYSVLQAADGREGIQVFRCEGPDLLLVDLRMPQVDGLAVLDVVRAESPDTPVIVVSGAGLLRDAIQALKKGACDYVTKPRPDSHDGRHMESGEIKTPQRRGPLTGFRPVAR